jgi:hypothetical protein
MALEPERVLEREVSGEGHTRASRPVPIGGVVNGDEEGEDRILCSQASAVGNLIRHG